MLGCGGFGVCCWLILLLVTWFNCGWDGVVNAGWLFACLVWFVMFAATWVCWCYWFD